MKAKTLIGAAAPCAAISDGPGSEEAVSSRPFPPRSPGSLSLARHIINGAGRGVPQQSLPGTRKTVKSQLDCIEKK